MELSPHTLTYKVADNCLLQADVYHGSGNGLWPTLLWLHGGGVVMGNRRMLPLEQAKHYVEAGYSIVAADYRLAPETQLGTIVEDIRSAYEWMRLAGAKLAGIDPDRIAIVGHSAGAYLALLAGSRLSPRPRALVSFYGYGCITSRWATHPSSFYGAQPMISREEAYRAVGRQPLSGSPISTRMPFYLYCRQHGLWLNQLVGVSLQQDRLAYERYSPIHHITSNFPPTLLLHGEADTDVPYEESVALARELERCGVDHELRLLAGYGHVFDTEGNGLRDPVIAAEFEAVLAFLARHMH